MINTCYTLPDRHVRHIRRVLGRGIVSNFTTAPTEHAHFENVCAWAKCPIPRCPKASLLSCSILDRGRRWNLSFKLLVTSYFLGPKQNYLGPSFCQASSLWFLVLSAPLMRGQVQTCAQTGSRPPTILFMLLLASASSISEQMPPYIS